MSPSRSAGGGPGPDALVSSQICGLPVQCVDERGGGRDMPRGGAGRGGRHNVIGDAGADALAGAVGGLRELEWLRIE